MSDTSQGHGWWLASDGKWYPPEAWTGPPPQMDQPTHPQPQYPTAQPPYPSNQPQYPSALPPYAYGAAMPPVTAWQQPRPNYGLAVASLICSCAGIIPFFFGVPCILGIIFGFVSRSRIKQSNGAFRGEGLALAGIIVGFSLIAIFIIAVILIAAFGHVQNCGGSESFRTTCT